MTLAQERADKAEAKLACINANVNKESVDDVLAIARMKVTDAKDLETVLTEMSKEERYEKFFGESDSDSDEGTGSNPGHLKDKDAKKKGSFGARLASSTAKNSEMKSSYF